MGRKPKMNNKAIAALCAATLLALVASCANPLAGKTGGGQGTGSLSLTLGGRAAAARTLVPAGSDLQIDFWGFGLLCGLVI